MQNGDALALVPHETFQLRRLGDNAAVTGQGFPQSGWGAGQNLQANHHQDRNHKKIGKNKIGPGHG